MPKTLLIIAHQPSPNTEELATAITTSASATANINCRLATPFAVNAEDVLDSDGLILFTTENFGDMSGALKDFFERIYYPCLHKPELNEGKPYALVVRAGIDGSGTISNVQRIINGLKWREVIAPTLCKGDYDRDNFIRQCQHLGATMAAGIEAEIY